MNDLELEAAIRYLQPNAEFSFTEADFDSIVWDKVEGNPPTLAEIEQALKDIKAQEAAKAKAKADLLERLGITSEEAKLLIS
jgi:hypothetical protein